MPRPKTRELATGASLSYTEDGPPERMIPAGEYFRISSIFAVQGRTTEKTFCSRTRRAISCEYCAPKSKTTIDWDSTDEFLKSEVPCKSTEMGRVAAGVHARPPQAWTPGATLLCP